MLSRVPLVSAVLIAAVAALGAQSPASQKPQDPKEPPRQIFRTEANFVRVDVFPTVDGMPVKDLTRADFRVLEDGVIQTIDSFEFVQVSAGVTRGHEPNTIRESRDALKDPRARVFVLFLDVPHVTIHGSWNIREPLVRLIDRVLAPDDLIGIMTPFMAASDIVFARKTDVIAGGLRDRWPWGDRFTLHEDEREFMYRACYPWEATKDVVKEMVARRREVQTLKALSELVLWLGDERDERKAILTVSEGWLLFRENGDLTRPRDLETGGQEPSPGPEPIGTGPDGRIRIGRTFGSEETISKSECDRDRLSLALIDNDYFMRRLIDDANRANASFYTVDPRGLPVFDSPIGPDKPPPLQIDQQILRRRIDTLRILADNTDGLAVVNSNDLEKGLRRMADDLTSYYLLGYYSTNAKLDGRFREIRVEVNRPGVDVRARRGYRAPTEEEVLAARKAATPAAVPESVTLAQNAIASLAQLRPSAPLRTRAVVLPGETPTVWLSGQLANAPSAATRAEIQASAGEITATAAAELAPGQRAFVVPFSLGGKVTGPIDIRVRISAEPGQPPLTDAVRVEPADGPAQPVMFRRGPATGNRVEPLGEPVFSRTERARFEVPLAGDAKLTAARLLDRNGAAIDLPVTLSERSDPAGQRWGVAEAVLAPLAPADYILEISAGSGEGENKRFTAFRVTR
ncbi:MAG TPA: VWA domain-containing protein [Vicinamibacterales bacterium]